MSKRYPLSSLLLVFLSAIQLTIAQVPQRKIIFSELEKTALQELKETNTPGAVLVIVSGDRVIFSKGFGVSNVETGTPMTPDMLFQIGSITKVFTATALVSLAEEGKLNLSEPIGKYVKGLHPKLAPITAHHLLTHTSGLRDEPAEYGRHEESALAEYGRSLKEDYLLLDPGKVFSYSNPGVALAGLLLEEISGKPYADEMDQRVFKPLGMNRTTFRPTTAMTYPHAVGHTHAGTVKPAVVRPMVDDTRFWPAGYMFCSAEDLARFVIALMNGGKVEGRQVLSRSLLAKLATPYVDVPNIFQNGKYGYGLFIYPHRGLLLLEHAGAMTGFSAVVEVVPQHHVGIILMANRDGVRLPRTAEKALELLSPLQPEAKAVPKLVLPMSASEMSSFAGTYTNRWSVELIAKDGKLFLQQFGAEFRVTRIGDRRFSVQPSEASEPQQFVLGPDVDGEPEYLHMFLWAFKRVGRAGSK
ncbi:MAG TPA: serine hydrolase domain-containing protein [Acidobacteriota bacterium]